jgi:hypothetical protein
MVGVGMVIVVVIVVAFAMAFNVAGSSGAEVTESVSSNESGEALRPFTRKCKTRVDQEVTAAGVFFFEIFIPVFGIKIWFAAIVKLCTFFGLGKVR